MKSIFKILVLGVVPILMATAVVDQGLAADKGSQLIFQSNMAHKSFISVANAHGSKAVTVLVQYYNDAMERVLWYLRVLPADSNVLVDPFDHMIPGTASDDDMDGTNVSEVLGALPAMSTDKQAGTNSGHFVIAVTAVGADVMLDLTDDDTDNPTANTAATANILFPTFLAKDMHGTDNIDNCGMLNFRPDPATADDDNLMYTDFGDKGKNDCKADDPDTIDNEGDTTSKNVGDLSVDNAQPIAFNHLTGHFTEALMSTPTGGADQTASWGGTPVVRPGVDDASNVMTNVTDYKTLNGENHDTAATPPGGGRLAEKDAGGMGATITNTGARTAYTAPSDIADEEDDATNRAIDDTGALVLPALHGGGDETKQIMLLLSVADDFGGAGKYELIAAKTGYKVVLMDNMGDALPDPAAETGPVFGGTDAPDAPAGVSIIVDGIRVMTNADLGKCTGTEIMGPWMLDNLTSLVPTASSGAKDFAGLDAMMTGSMNAAPGWIKFMRSELTCKKDYGDGDSPQSPIEDDDGVPTKEERTYTAGTLVVEQKDSQRAFVTTGRALLKFITADSTFAASWSLKSPASPTADDTTDD